MRVVVGVLALLLLSSCTPGPTADSARRASTTPSATSSTTPSSTDWLSDPTLTDIYGPAGNGLFINEDFQMAIDRRWIPQPHPLTWSVGDQRGPALLVITQDQTPTRLHLDEALNSALVVAHSAYPSLRLQDKRRARGPARNALGMLVYTVRFDGSTHDARSFVVAGERSFIVATLIASPRAMPRLLARLEPYLLTLREA